MKLQEFTYTKADGTISQRAIIVTSEPTKNISGYDVTQLSESEFAEFVEAYRVLKDRQLQETMELLSKFELNNSYRNFIPERMSNITTEHV